MLVRGATGVKDSTKRRDIEHSEEISIQVKQPRLHSRRVPSDRYLKMMHNIWEKGFLDKWVVGR